MSLNTTSLLQPAKKSGKKFLNPVPTQVGGPGMMFKVLPLYFNNPAEVEPKQPLGPFTTDPSLYSKPSGSGLRVTWFGHSASLIEIDGVRVLIDPVWEERASPFQFFGPRRFFAPTLALEDLPPLDVVLVSHDHYDHLGADTLRTLAALPQTQNAVWVTSLGVGERLERLNVRQGQLKELNWTQKVRVKGLEITAWPARHFSGRWLTDRFTTLWSSFVLEGPDHRVFYGADSGYWDGFSEIASKYAGFDLTMLEIGAFHPLWDSIHLGPENAAKAYKTMGMTGLLMPIHWGLFNLALHAWKQPITQMLEISSTDSLKLWLPEPGKPTDVEPETELNTEWWMRS